MTAEGAGADPFAGGLLAGGDVDHNGVVGPNGAPAAMSAAVAVAGAANAHIADYHIDIAAAGVTAPGAPAEGSTEAEVAEGEVVEVAESDNPP